MRWRGTRLLGIGAGVAAALALFSAVAIANEIKVVATIKPIHALVTQVMHGVGVPELLIKGQASPHTYAMKPSDAKALHAADVVFRVSEQTEPFTKKIVTSLPDTVRVVTLSETTGLELLDARTGDTFEAHDHAAHDHAAHDHENDRGHSAGETARDGHVWLDPENAKMMAGEIAQVLSEKFPAHADVFQVNARQTIADLDTLTAEIAADLAVVKDKPFVVFHDAYQYFERRFGLKAVGAITVSPEVQPSAKRLSEVRAKLRSLGAVCVFAEPQFKSGLVDTVIESTGAMAGVLDPEGATVVAGSGAYSQLLRGLAAGLKGCLGS